MNWNQNYSMVWDWENLAAFSPATTENPSGGLFPESRAIGAGAARHGSLSSSAASLTSSSELGHGSSKSSMSASIGSRFEEGNNVEFNFTAVNRHEKNMCRSGEAVGVEDSGTPPSMTVADNYGEPSISLKLGKGTLFENVRGGKDAKGPATSSSAVAKKAKVSQQNTRSAYCQVEGCKFDLSSAKHYHRKHKVCEAHTKAPMVIVAGMERRFCQQCSRLHGLAEFDGNKRSCRRRLSRHNARRRKQQADTISFSSSRLSAMISEAGHQTNIFHSKPPPSQVGGNALSLWNKQGGFKFTGTKIPRMKPAKTGDLNDRHLATLQTPNCVLAHAVHYHDFYGLTPFKGTNAKVISHGVEAPAMALSSNGGGPDPGRALSLLSTDSWGSASGFQRPGSQAHSVSGDVTPLDGFRLTASNRVLHAPGSTPGVPWQLDEGQQIQAFTHL